MATGIWLAACAVYLTGSYPPFSPDSYVYVAAAQSFVESGHFTLPFALTTVESLPVPLAAWPPGYPLLIALVTMIGTDPWPAARWVAGLSTACALLLAWAWVRSHKGGSAAIAMSALGAMTATVATTVWSEGPFFLALCLLAGGLASSARSHDHSLWTLVWVCSSLCAALLLRHAGWFLVPAVFFLLLRYSRSRRWQAVVFCLCALLPAATLLLRARSAGAWATGWEIQGASVWRAFAESAAALGRVAVVPWSGSPALQATFGALLIIWLWHAGRPRNEETWRDTPGVAFILGLTLLAGTWAVRVVEPTFIISDRLVWPGWMCMATAALLRMDGLVHRVRLRRWIFALLVLSHTAGILVLPETEPRHCDSNHNFHAQGQLTADQIVISNEAWRSWHLFGTPGYYLPRSRWGQGVFHADTLTAWAHRRGVTRLIWFEDGLSALESVSRYGDLGHPNRGQSIPALRLVETADTYHTYVIEQPEEP